MKKLILVASIIVFASFTSYTKNNIAKLVSPVKVQALANDTKSSTLGYTYNSRLDIAQADGNN